MQKVFFIYLLLGQALSVINRISTLYGCLLSYLHVIRYPSRHIMIFNKGVLSKGVIKL